MVTWPFKDQHNGTVFDQVDETSANGKYNFSDYSTKKWRRAGLGRVAKASGFSLLASVNCDGQQKDKRERIFRYLARPPVAAPRLCLSSTGKVVYTLKTP